ncbi:MAG: hypothetical protein HRT40_12945, partial [Campylobacteraceae bacterium]|nr:hypothetical protein [Campylobacteraceae bacterium]
MEKQLNITLDSKVENVKIKSKSSEDVKTGKSLFDQLLANTNKNITSKTISKDKNDISKTTINLKNNSQVTTISFDNKPTSLLD